MNTDDDNNIFPEGDFLNAENVDILSSADGKVAGVKRSNGARQILDSEITVGDLIIGQYESFSEQRIFYFVKGVTSTIGNIQYDRVLCYDYQSNKVYRILEQPSGIILNFNDTPITGITKIGDWLFWTQDNDEPKRINVERAIKTFHPEYRLGNPESPIPYGIISKEDITVIRRGPRYAPTVEKIISGVPADLPILQNNFIQDNAFQFAYRYIYRDGEVSVLSPYSILMNYNNEGESFDAILVAISSLESVVNEVNKIQILVRIGNFGNFAIVKEFERGTNGQMPTLSFYFLNDVAGITISAEDSAKPFDNVPVSSRCVEAAKNRTILANNTYGYVPAKSGLIRINAQSTSGISLQIKGDYVFVTFEYQDITANFTELRYLVLRVATAPNDEDNGYYLLTGNDPSISTDLFLTGTLPGVITLNRAWKILDEIAEGDDDLTLAIAVNPGFVLGTAPLTVNRNYQNKPDQYDGDVILQGVSGGTNEGNRTFKSNSRYRLGIVFYDTYGRNMGVYSPDSAVVQIPKRTYNQISSYPIIDWTLEFTSEQIPSWATHYQIVRTKSLNYLTFLQGVTNDIKYVTKDSNGEYVIGSISSHSQQVVGIAINLSDITSWGGGYTFTDGDICTIWFSDDVTHNLRAIDQFGSYVILAGKNIENLPTIGKNCVFEIATQRKTLQAEPFYEVGYTYSITNPGATNRTLSVTSGIFLGDSYVKSRPSSFGQFLLEAMNINDLHWDEWLTDVGRPNITIPDAGIEYKPTNIVYSNVWVQGTIINGLCTFDALDQADLDQANGPIRKLLLTSKVQQYGNVLLAICESETCSIYLEETQILDNQGAAILATSGRFIGTVNTLRGGYGTLNPESVASSSGLVFWVDVRSGAVVQYSSNGLAPISANKMDSFFKRRLYNYSGRDLYGCIDGKRNRYLIYLKRLITPSTLSDYSPAKESPHEPKDNAVVMFNYDTNAWCGFLIMQPEFLSQVADEVVSFRYGILYVHDSQAFEFHGIQFDSTVSVLIGKPAAMIRSLQSVTLESDRKPDWVHARCEFPLVQSTDIESSEFTLKEGFFHAPFYRDRLTPGYRNAEESLMYGEALRGKFIKVAIRFSGLNNDATLSSIAVRFDPSFGYGELPNY